MVRFCLQELEHDQNTVCTPYYYSKQLANLAGVCRFVSPPLSILLYRFSSTLHDRFQHSIKTVVSKINICTAVVQRSRSHTW